MGLKKGFQEIDIEKLVSADWNYKRADQGSEDFSMLEQLKNNMKRNGQVENLLIRELDTGFFEVVNGNHRLQVMKELKMKKAWVFNFGKITLAQAKLIAVETNETKFEADQAKLAALIQELKLDFPVEDLSASLPFTDFQMKQFDSLTNFAWDDIQDPTASTLPTPDQQHDDFETITIKVPKDVAEQFHAVLKRFKEAMYPNQDPKDVSIVLPFEAMLQHLHQIPDNQITGENPHY